MKLINQHPITFAAYSVRDYVRNAVRDRSPFRIAVVGLGGIGAAWIVHLFLGWLAQLAAIVVLVYGAFYWLDRFLQLKKL